MTEVKKRVFYERAMKHDLCICKVKENRPYSRRPIAISIFCRICPRKYCPIKTGFRNKNGCFLTAFLLTESQPRQVSKLLKNSLLMYENKIGSDDVR